MQDWLRTEMIGLGIFCAKIFELEWERGILARFETATPCWGLGSAISNRR